MAAGPPVKAEKEKAEAETTNADEPKAEPPARPALPPMPPLPRLPVLTPAPSVVTPAAEAPAANGATNGNHAPEDDARAEIPAPPAPALWTPPLGERWDGQAVRAGRFIRERARRARDGRVALRAPRRTSGAGRAAVLPAFHPPRSRGAPESVPVGEATAAETATEPPTPPIFKSPPVDAPEPGRAAATLAVARGPRPSPTRRLRAMPDPLPAEPGSWTGFLDRRAAGRARAPRALRAGAGAGGGRGRAPVEAETPAADAVEDLVP